MKNVLLDSSSLILLFHTGLIEKLAGHFSLYITREVELEITKKVKPGAARFQDHIHQGVLNVLHAPQIRLQNKRLGIGEASILSAWNSGSADFVILDDRQAILHAKENDIPFINALLVPKILFVKRFFRKTTLSLPLKCCRKRAITPIQYFKRLIN